MEKDGDERGTKKDGGREGQSRMEGEVWRERGAEKGGGKEGGQRGWRERGTEKDGERGTMER